MKLRTLAKLAIAAVAAGVTPAAAGAQSHGPANGYLIVSGGAERSTEIYDKFIALAGGPDALILVVPTSGDADTYDDSCACLKLLRAAHARNLKILHTRDRNVANSDAFVEPMRHAGGIWFAEGNSWRHQDAYLDTKVQHELFALLARGGVVGGGSAGGRIQGEYIPLRSPEPKQRAIPEKDWRRGFGLLKNVAIDAHVLVRNRQFDMLGLIEAHPNLLGIGIDENTALVVHGDAFDVIGSSYAIIYDDTRQIQPVNDESLRTVGGRFYFLRPGDHYDMSTRLASRPPSGHPPTDRVVRSPWKGPPVR
jgi:cyanophycinase